MEFPFYIDIFSEGHTDIEIHVERENEIEEEREREKEKSERHRQKEIQTYRKYAKRERRGMTYRE